MHIYNNDVRIDMHIYVHIYLYINRYFQVLLAVAVSQAKIELVLKIRFELRGLQIPRKLISETKT